MEQVRRFLRNTWVPLAIAGTLAVAILVVVPWYYRQFRGVEPERGLRRDELAWADRYAPWRAEAREILTAAYEARSDVDRSLERRLDQASGCGPSFRRAVGPAPERLARVETQAGTACARVEGARAAFAQENGPNAGTSTLLAASLDALRHAELELRRLMLAETLLERREEPSEESRIDERLSFAASLVHVFVEVRCWAAEDWPTVRAELAAVGLERLAARTAHANAYRFTVHLAPDTCAPLVAVAYGRAAAASPSDERLAPALVALLHAAEHLSEEGGEEQIDCTAIARVAPLARALRIPPRRAARLAELARASASRCPSR